MSDTTSTPPTDAAPPAEASAGTTPTSTETPATSAPSTPAPSTPATPAPVEDVTGLKAALEAARRDAKTTAKELAALKQSAMTDQEKAIAAAKADGLAEATTKYGKRLALAEFTSAAATAGRDAGGVLDLIDMSRFIGDDGEVDSKAITKAVEKLPALAAAAPPAGVPATPPRTGGDHRGGTGAGSPITREQLKSMTPEEITTARAEGRLNHLL